MTSPTKGMHYKPSEIHKREKDSVLRGFFGYDYRKLQKDPNWRPDEDKTISMVMRPGEAIMFWSTLMHASHSGKTNEMRLGFASRFMLTSVRIYPDTDFTEKYGGRVSLAKYGAVQTNSIKIELRRTRLEELPLGLC